jgi:hypothetical protein
MKPADVSMALNIAKAIVFLYILASPFIDHHKYLSHMDNILAKLVMLILIITVSFYDFQLAILLTIALFVMIINFNKEQINKILSTPQLSASIPPTPYVISQESFDKSSLRPVEAPKFIEPFDLGAAQEVLPYESDIMYTFPDASCNTKPFGEDDMSNNLISHYIDPKIKPYEVYISMMTNQEKLDNAQNNMVI